jgi:hypothetical protein
VDESGDLGFTEKAVMKKTTQQQSVERVSAI